MDVQSDEAYTPKIHPAANRRMANERRGLDKPLFSTQPNPRDEATEIHSIFGCLHKIVFEKAAKMEWFAGLIFARVTDTDWILEWRWGRTQASHGDRLLFRFRLDNRSTRSAHSHEHTTTRMCICHIVYGVLHDTEQWILKSDIRSPHQHDSHSLLIIRLNSNSIPANALGAPADFRRSWADIVNGDDVGNYIVLLADVRRVESWMRLRLRAVCGW